MRRPVSIIVPILTSSILVSVLNATAISGTVTFTGNIMDAVCTVETLSVSQTGALGKVTDLGLNRVVDGNAPSRFTINLTQCPETVTSAKLRFDGITSSINNIVYNSKLDKDKANAVIALYHKYQSKLIPVKIDTPHTQLTSTRTNTLTYMVKRNAKTAPDVPTELITSTISFTISYN